MRFVGTGVALLAACLTPTVTAAADTGTPPQLLRTIGGPGHAAIYPSGVEVAANGTIVASDIGNDQVKRFQPDGTLMWSVGGTGTGLGKFNNPRDVAIDANGAVYVADTGNNRIVKLSASGAWLFSFQGPVGNKMSPPIGVSAQGSLVYVADPAQRKVRIFDTTGTQVREMVTNGACNFSQVRDAAPDAAGNVYVANYLNNNILKLDPSGSCIAAFGTKGSGPGQFMNPYGVTVGTDPVLGTEALYVADSNNNRLQEFTVNGVFVAQAGVAGDGTPGTFSALRRVGVARDGTGDVWGADPWGYRLERFARSAGGYTYAQTIGGVPPSSTSSAVFNGPHGVGVDASGNVVVADTVNQRLVRFSPSGALLNVCGSRGDGSGQFNWPRGASVDQTSDLIWVADTKQSDIQLLHSDCSTGGKFGTAGAAPTSFNWPYAIAVRQSDRIVWIADTRNNRVAAYQASGRTLISTFGTLGSGAGQFSEPRGLGLAMANGHVLVADTKNNRIVELADTGGTSVTVVRTLTGGFKLPEGVAADGQGRIYVADTGNNRVVVLNAAGVEIATITNLSGPSSVTVDANDAIYVSDTGNDRVQVYSYGAPIGPGTPPHYLKNLVGPGMADMYSVDIAASATDYYVADPGRYRVLEVNRSTGAIDGVAGGHQGDLPGQFGAMRAVAVDSAGFVYVADTPNSRIEKFTANLQFVSTFGTKGTGPGQFAGQAYGVTTGIGKLANGASAEVLYAVDGNGRVEKFDLDGNYISEFGAGLLRDPRQLDVHPTTHNVYVVNARDHQVVVFDLDGARLFSFGSGGSGPGQFQDDPRGITINPSGTVYVTDSGNDRIEAFDTSGAYLFTFGSSGSGPGQFTAARGLVATDDGVVTVTDEWDYSLKIFTQNGAFVSRSFGAPPPVPGVDSPRGIRIDSTGRVFVTDWWNQRIDRLNGDGSAPFAWGQRGTTRDPGSINFAWDVALQPGTDRIFVANRESHEIEVFTVDGVFVTRWGTRGTNPGQLQFPQGLTFAPDGTLLVADSANGRIERFSIGADSVGTFLTTYGTPGPWGSGPGFLDTPTGISTAPDGTIWVADTGNNSIQKMTPNGTWTRYRTAVVIFRQPWGVTVAPDGSIWVADSGNDRVVKMASDGTVYFAKTGVDLGAGAFDGPHSIAFAPNGHVYVSDVWNNRVVELGY